MRKLNIYIFARAFYCDYNKKEINCSIKLTLPPFHVRKEVIIASYAADQARPVMTEGWSKEFTASLSRHTCSKVHLQTNRMP